MVDKEFLTTNVLQGVAFPLYVLVPEGNQAWYDEEKATAISEKYVGLDENTRLQLANETLVAGGFTWETDPVTDEDGVITPGVGLIDPDGVKLVQQEIMAPPASYDPLRATAALWIEGWMEKLGIDAKANPTDFNTIVAKVWPGIGEEITFDTYILGWSLGNAAWPTFHESFFHTRHWAETDDGGNATGYSDEEFDALADAMFAETDRDVAFDMIWQMEEKLATDLPYVVLFDTPITEFYSKEVVYPFTSTLSGVQFLNGMQGNVAK
jgi:ABC-type transport system substrate-binding protein